MFVPCVVLAVGLFSGNVWGAVFGMITGLLCDFAYTESSVLFTILLTIIGFATGVIMESVLNKRFFSYVMTCAAALLICAVMQGFGFLFFRPGENLTVIYVILLQTLFSLPFALPIYFLCRAISRID